MQKSQFGDAYNHDPWAAKYDADVQNETHPIRAGYEETLNWVIASAGITPKSHVLDLGSGTGNLSMRIPACASLTCVDLSTKMTDLARPKLRHLSDVRFVQADLLSYFVDVPFQFDAVISTYAVHHLTETEKQVFFKHIGSHVRPGGRAVFGDLMVADEAAEAAMIEHFRHSAYPDVADDIDEEFFWLVDTAKAGLSAQGFAVEVKRFSTLSWGIAAVKMG